MTARVGSCPPLDEPGTDSFKLPSVGRRAKLHFSTWQSGRCICSVSAFPCLPSFGHVLKSTIDGGHAHRSCYLRQSCNVFSLVMVGQPLQRVQANRRVSISINDLPRRPKLLYISFGFAAVVRWSRRSHTLRQHAAQRYKRFARRPATHVCTAWDSCVAACFNASPVELAAWLLHLLCSVKSRSPRSASW